MFELIPPDSMDDDFDPCDEENLEGIVEVAPKGCIFNGIDYTNEEEDGIFDTCFRKPAKTR